MSDNSAGVFVLAIYLSICETTTDLKIQPVLSEQKLKQWQVFQKSNHPQSGVL